VLRVEGEVGRNEGGDGTTKVFLLFESSTDESPSWLVVVPFGSLKKRKRVEGDAQRRGRQGRGGEEGGKGGSAQLDSKQNQLILSHFLDPDSDRRAISALRKSVRALPAYPRALPILRIAERKLSSRIRKTRKGGPPVFLESTSSSLR